MKTITQLIKENDHTAILALEGDEFLFHRFVALIKLGRYVEALKIAPSDPSFEVAYVLYKLKRYKKAMAILKQIKLPTDEKTKILASQILFFMGRYNEAYDTLKSTKMEDETVINLAAMRSMSVLAHHFDLRIPNAYSIVKKDETTSFLDLNVKDKSLKEEYIYNDNFSLLFDEKMYVSELEKSEYATKGGYISNQLNNMKGIFDRVNMSLLNGSNMDIYKFNVGEVNRFKNPVHYLKNATQIDSRFWPIVPYPCFMEAIRLDFRIKDGKISGHIPILRMLNAYINLKRMVRGEKFTRRYFDLNSPVLLMRVISVLAMRRTDMVGEFKPLVKKTIWSVLKENTIQ